MTLKDGIYADLKSVIGEDGTQMTLIVMMGADLISVIGDWRLQSLFGAEPTIRVFQRRH